MQHPTLNDNKRHDQISSVMSQFKLGRAVCYGLGLAGCCILLLTGCVSSSHQPPVTRLSAGPDESPQPVSVPSPVPVPPLAFSVVVKTNPVKQLLFRWSPSLSTNTAGYRLTYWIGTTTNIVGVAGTNYQQGFTNLTSRIYAYVQATNTWFVSTSSTIAFYPPFIPDRITIIGPSNGMVFSKTTMAGPWLQVGPVPQTFPFTNNQMFFRTGGSTNLIQYKLSNPLNE